MGWEEEEDSPELVSDGEFRRLAGYGKAEPELRHADESKSEQVEQGRILGEWYGEVFIFAADGQVLTPCDCSRASLEEKLLFFPGKDSPNEKP